MIRSRSLALACCVSATLMASGQFGCSDDGGSKGGGGAGETAESDDGGNENAAGNDSSADDDSADDDSADDDSADDDSADDDSADDDSAECIVGSEACACYPNDTCNGSLSCFSGICVDAGDAGTGGSGNGGGGAPPDSGTGGADEPAPSTGGSNRNTGGTDGNTGGTDGNTGGTDGNTGGTDGNTGGTQEATGGTQDETGGTTEVPTGGTTSSGTGGSDASTGGTDPGTGGSSAGHDPVTTGNSGIVPSDGGDFVWDWDVSGVIGPWYMFDDGEGSSVESVYDSPISESTIGSSGGALCFEGSAEGHLDLYYEEIWGAGAGLVLCEFPEDASWLPAEVQSLASPGDRFLAEDCPTRLAGVNSVTFTISGSWSEMRLEFSVSDTGTQPFIEVPTDGTYTLDAVDSEVPLSWDDPNAGAQGTPNILTLNFHAVSQTYTQPFSFCISDITIN